MLICFRNLPPEVLYELGLILDPPLSTKDYRSLAGKMNCRYRFVKNLDRKDKPTEALLEYWWSSEGSKTVRDLINLLKEIDRHDAIDELLPHEYRGMSFCALTNIVLEVFKISHQKFL